jgi:Cys-rich protein (TIGR04453 family)
MTRRLAPLALLALLAAGCSAPSEQECRAACDNIVRVTARHVEMITEEDAAKLAAEAAAQLEPCVEKCVQGSKSHAACLAAAKSLKEARECAVD